MKPDTLTTLLFLDGGDAQETIEMSNTLGFLDGQTTNPTLISKNPEVQERLDAGEKFTKDEMYDLYKTVVTTISPLVEHSVSVEVYADASTTAEEMIVQGKEMNTWIPNAHVKLPVTVPGLNAASALIKEGIRVNMTLVFTQQQAAAVHAATIGAAPGQVYLSPFVGRLDDKGINGIGLIENIVKMYTKQKSHVMVLTASVRSVRHVKAAIAAGSDAITAPARIYTQWIETDGMLPPDEEYEYPATGLEAIPFEKLDLQQSWDQFDISHELTDAGVARFSEDWNSLLV